MFSLVDSKALRKFHIINILRDEHYAWPLQLTFEVFELVYSAKSGSSSPKKSINPHTAIRHFINLAQQYFFVGWLFGDVGDCHGAHRVCCSRNNFWQATTTAMNHAQNSFIDKIFGFSSEIPVKKIFVQKIKRKKFSFALRSFELFALGGNN